MVRNSVEIWYSGSENDNERGLIDLKMPFCDLPNQFLTIESL
jgi:hypothetical protein